MQVVLAPVLQPGIRPDNRLFPEELTQIIVSVIYDIYEMSTIHRKEDEHDNWHS